jgi:formamidopyrimidine-DNA glycosylase
MPELAEVAYYTTRWAAGVGQEVLRVHTGPKSRPFRQTAAGAFRALVGTTYGGARTHGKNMLFEFAPQLWLTGASGDDGGIAGGAPGA